MKKYKCPKCKGTHIIVNPIPYKFKDKTQIYNAYCENWNCRKTFKIEVEDEYYLSIVNIFNPNDFV